MSKTIRCCLLPFGYKTYAGVILTDGQVDALNRVQRRVNSFIKNGFAVPEHILNGRFNLFTAFSQA